jgi:hypothetical protein
MIKFFGELGLIAHGQLILFKNIFYEIQLFGRIIMFLLKKKHMLTKKT